MVTALMWVAEVGLTAVAWVLAPADAVVPSRPNTRPWND